MSAIAIIPARGGSKRIPRKNIRLFHGKPIIAYSIEAAKSSGLFDGIFVSTDDEEIGRISEEEGARWHLRPEELSDDETGTQAVASECLKTLCNYGDLVPSHVCCIYPAAPTMIGADIGAVYAMSRMDDWKRIMYVKGWLYWGTAKRFIKCPELESTDQRIDLVPHRWIDINTEDDWQRAEAMYAAR